MRYVFMFIVLKINLKAKIDLIINQPNGHHIRNIIFNDTTT